MGGVIERGHLRGEHRGVPVGDAATSSPSRMREVSPLSAARVVAPSKHSPGPSPYIGWKWSNPTPRRTRAPQRAGPAAPARPRASAVEPRRSRSASRPCSQINHPPPPGAALMVKNRAMATATESSVYYDPYDVGINADPYPTFKRLRDEAPAYYNERFDVWALSRHADVERSIGRLEDVLVVPGRHRSCASASRWPPPARRRGGRRPGASPWSSSRW